MSVPKILTVALFIKNGENFSNKEKYFMANPAGCFLFVSVGSRTIAPEENYPPTP